MAVLKLLTAATGAGVVTAHLLGGSVGGVIRLSSLGGGTTSLGALLRLLLVVILLLTIATAVIGTRIIMVLPDPDLGEQLGCGAHLTRLRRTRVGDRSVEDCIRPEDFESFIRQTLDVYASVHQTDLRAWRDRIAAEGENRQNQF